METTLGMAVVVAIRVARRRRRDFMMVGGREV